MSEAFPEANELDDTAPIPREVPTVQDFYVRMGKLEAGVQNAELLKEVLERMAVSSPSSTTGPVRDMEEIVDELLEEEPQDEELEVLVEDVAEQQQKTRMDLQKVGQLVEQVQRWTYLSLAAVLVWRVVGTTLRNCSVSNAVRAMELSEVLLAPDGVLMR